MTSGGWWCVRFNSHVKYVQGSYKGQQVMLHHMVIGVRDDKFVDHINGDGLDNTRGNLRLVSPEQNSKNCSIAKNNNSGRTGVHKLKNGKYLAHIVASGEQKWLGTYGIKEEAYKAREEAEVKYVYHPNHGRSAIVYE